MVRINASGSVDDRNDAPSKKKPSSRMKKAAPITGVWPCKINGCNKEFAREADLKRHQRTTKLHSLPSYPCPQCEATFTRPDALRRHQKSRHNGVIIEARRGLGNEGAEEDEARSPSSQSRSRSGSVTPAPKGKEPMEFAKYHHSHPTPSSSFVPSRPSFVNTDHDPIALPTSATRLNNAVNWSSSNPWPGHSNLPPIHMPMYYIPSSHYRIDGPPPMLHPVSQILDSAFSKSASQESSSRTTLSNRPLSYTSSERTTTEHDPDSTRSSPGPSHTTPVIDPSLESEEVISSVKQTKEQVRALSLGTKQTVGIEPAEERVEDRLVENDEGCSTKRSVISTNLNLRRSRDPGAAEPTKEQKVGVDNGPHSQTRQPEVQGNGDADKIDDKDDRNTGAKPGESRQPGDDQGAMLSPGSWLSICLR